MRLILFGSTAMAALGGAAVGVVAGNGIELEIGGTYKGAAGVILSEDYSDSSDVSAGDVRYYVFAQDVELQIGGETVLDNGLTVGARIELEAQSSDEQIDGVFAYISGFFGELRFGDTAEAYAELCYQVPTASELFGADSPDFSFSNAGIAGYGATNGTCYGIDDNATKLVYFSPVFAGFQFAASFAPEHMEDTRNLVDGAGMRFSNDPEQNSENLSVAATFTHDLKGIVMSLGGGATLSFDKEVNPNNTSAARGYNAYARAEFSQFTIGVASEWRENFTEDGSDQWVYGAGATYSWNDWTVGLGWTRGDYGKALGANGVGPFNADHDIVGLTAVYELESGISIDGVLQYSGYASCDSAGPDYRGVALGIGTLIAF